MLGVVSDKSDPNGFARHPHQILLHACPTVLPNVQAWFIACDSSGPQLPVEVLTPSEIARGERLARPADRAAFTVTRATLRRVLARELGVAPRAVRLVEPEFGKPRLCASHARPDIDFSVSHTDAMSVVALARHALVGVDIEQRRAVPENHKIASEIFGRHAAAALAALPPCEQDAAFLRLWTAGEAYVKATGTGLARRRGIPLCIAADGAGVAFRRNFDERDAWRLAFIDAPAGDVFGYVCCLATLDHSLTPATAR